MRIQWLFYFILLNYLVEKQLNFIRNIFPLKFEFVNILNILYANSEDAI